LRHPFTRLGRAFTPRAFRLAPALPIPPPMKNQCCRGRFSPLLGRKPGHPRPPLFGPASSALNGPGPSHCLIPSYHNSSPHFNRSVTRSRFHPTRIPRTTAHPAKCAMERHTSDNSPTSPFPDAPGSAAGIGSVKSPAASWHNPASIPSPRPPGHNPTPSPFAPPMAAASPTPWPPSPATQPPYSASSLPPATPGDRPACVNKSSYLSRSTPVCTNVHAISSHNLDKSSRRADIPTHSIQITGSHPRAASWGPSLADDPICNQGRHTQP